MNIEVNEQGQLVMFTTWQQRNHGSYVSNGLFHGESINSHLGYFEPRRSIHVFFFGKPVVDPQLRQLIS